MDSRELTTVLLVILGVIVLLPILGMALWGGGMMGPGMMGPGMMGPGMMGRSGWGGGPGGFLIVLLLIAGIALVVLGFTRREGRAEEPLEILKRRLARGEITREQYDELKQALH